MEWYNWIILNKEIVKLFYGLIIAIICLVIVAKAHKLYHLSFYEGIRYFRNAFLFFAVAFIIRYIFGEMSYFGIIDSQYTQISTIVFEFFIILAGFFLLYSLIWKKIEGEEGSYSSLLNLKVIIFYAMAFIITIIDLLWNSYYAMFFSESLIFIIASIMSYVNYIKNGRKGKFLKFYFVAMILALIAWILNAISAYYLDWNKGILISVYILNIFVFLMFLYGIIKITKKPGSK